MKNFAYDPRPNPLGESIVLPVLSTLLVGVSHFLGCLETSNIGQPNRSTKDPVSFELKNESFDGKNRPKLRSAN